MTTEHAGSSTERPGAGGLALVVDDEPAVLRLLERVVRSSGCEVATAADGAGALRHLGESSFDVVVSDIMLPDINGLELLVEIRRHAIDLPVIFVTGAPSLDTAVQAIQHGAFRYFTKPFEPAELADAVRRAVSLGRLAAIKRQALEAQGLSEGVVADLAGTAARFDGALDTVWLAFQPLVTPRMEVYGYEALLRCDDPVLNRPGLVFSAAEQLGKVNDVGRVVRGRAAEAMAARTGDWTLFVNIHPTELFSPRLMREDDIGLLPHAGRVVLEITERAALDGDPTVAGRISALREMGFRIAIDDLGAGYASLSSFAMLQPDVVKIDMSLVHGVDVEPMKRRLVQSMIELCRDMGIVVVGEGVETPGQRDVLIDLGCDLLQGFLFARPARDFPAVEA